MGCWPLPSRTALLQSLCACCLQSKLESIQFKLRIPQRKPWGAIAEDATSAAITMGQVDKVRPGHGNDQQAAVCNSVAGAALGALVAPGAVWRYGSAASFGWNSGTWYGRSMNRPG